MKTPKIIRFWTKAPITIRAAYIAGTFALAAVLIAWGLGLLTRRLQTPARPASPQDRALSIVRIHFRYTTDGVRNFRATWCDLAGRGEKKEFYATYTRNYTDYLTVFTTVQKDAENLYHRHSKGGYDLHGAHATVDGVPYLLCATKVGSGSFLDLYVFRYDGVGKLTLVYQKDSLFQGQLWVVDNTAYVEGGSKRYTLKRTGDAFVLVPYTDRVKYVEGSATHVLAYDIVGGELRISWDDKPIPFKKVEDYFVSETPVRLSLDEQIVEDDNIVGANPQQIRLLCRRGEFDYRPGFFGTYVPRKPGQKEFSVSYNYGVWYHIKVLVEQW